MKQQALNFSAANERIAATYFEGKQGTTRNIAPSIADI